jgi:hypothetical protein
MTPLPNAQAEVIDLVLNGLAQGRDLDELAQDVGEHHLRDRFPGTILLELAARAFVAARVSPSDPLHMDRLDKRVLPEWPARGKTAHQKRRYCLHAAVLLSTGVEPEDTSWWRVNDLWAHALDAAVVYVRVAAERRGVTVADVCNELRSAPWPCDTDPSISG